MPAPVQHIAVRYRRHVILGGNVPPKLAKKYPDRKLFFAKLVRGVWQETADTKEGQGSEWIYVMPAPPKAKPEPKKRKANP